MLHPPSMKKDNSGFVYILVVQDIFSRKIWALPLKNKTGETIIENLKIILKEMKPFKKDARLIIDRGTEYLNKKIKHILEEKNISISHPSDRHASHVEISLQRLLYQQIEQAGRKSLNWIKFLPNAVSIINNRYLRIIKMSPNEAEKKNNEQKLMKLCHYIDKRHLRQKEKEENYLLNLK